MRATSMLLLFVSIVALLIGCGDDDDRKGNSDSGGAIEADENRFAERSSGTYEGGDSDGDSDIYGGKLADVDSDVYDGGVADADSGARGSRVTDGGSVADGSNAADGSSVVDGNNTVDEDSGVDDGGNTHSTNDAGDAMSACEPTITSCALECGTVDDG